MSFQYTLCFACAAMSAHAAFHAYQAHIAGTRYLAIPRQAGMELRVEIHLLRHADADDITDALVSSDGRLLEASKLAVSRDGHEYAAHLNPGALSDATRRTFRCIAAAVLGCEPVPVPYTAIDVLSLPRRHLAL